jgi:hypothetical protein
MGDALDAIAADTPTYYTVQRAEVTAGGDFKFTVRWYDANGESMAMGIEIAETSTITVADLGLAETDTVLAVLQAFYTLRKGQFETISGLTPLPE